MVKHWASLWCAVIVGCIFIHWILCIWMFYDEYVFCVLCNMFCWKVICIDWMLMHNVTYRIVLMVIFWVYWGLFPRFLLMFYRCWVLNVVLVDRGTVCQDRFMRRAAETTGLGFYQISFTSYSQQILVLLPDSLQIHTYFPEKYPLAYRSAGGCVLDYFHW